MSQTKSTTAELAQYVQLAADRYLDRRLDKAAAELRRLSAEVEALRLSSTALRAALSRVVGAYAAAAKEADKAADALVDAAIDAARLQASEGVEGKP